MYLSLNRQNILGVSFNNFLQVINKIMNFTKFQGGFLYKTYDKIREINNAVLITFVVYRILSNTYVSKNLIRHITF